MGFGLDTLAKIGLAPVSGGMSLGVGEDELARIPVVGGLLGAQSDEQKALLKKQQQMADELKRRAQQNQQARMNALGQQMLAFNPQNQLMAQMFGPDAAFTPDQFAQMVADPMANQQAAHEAWQRSLASGKSMTPEEQEQYQRAQADLQRQAQVRQNMQPVGPGPAPLKLPAPAPARRF